MVLKNPRARRINKIMKHAGKNWNSYIPKRNDANVRDEIEFRFEGVYKFQHSLKQTGNKRYKSVRIK